MQLKASTDYGMRAVLYLAAQEKTCSSKDIADSMSIPRDYLIQLAQSLRNAGIIEARPGKHGGYRLAKEPRDISLYDVIVALDEDSRRGLRTKRKVRVGGEMAAGIRQMYDTIDKSIDRYFASITIDMLLGCARGEGDGDELLASCFEAEARRLRG